MRGRGEGSKTTQLLQLLADADEPISVDDAHAQLDGEPGDERKTAALLKHLRTRGEAFNNGGRGDGLRWVRHTNRHLLGVDAEPEAAPAPAIAPDPAPARRPKAKKVQPRAAKRAAKTVPVTAHVVVAEPKRHGGNGQASVGVLEDGSLVVIEGDRVAKRLTPEETASVLKVVQRITGATR